MHLLEDIEKAGVKLADFFNHIVTGASTLQTIWKAVSGPTIAVAAAVFYDTVKTVVAAEAAAGEAGAGNFTGAIQLSENTVALVKTLVSDFKSGVATVKADFEALHIKL